MTNITNLRRLKWRQKGLLLFVLGSTPAWTFPLILRRAVLRRYSTMIYTEATQIPERPTAIVFGAAVINGSPSVILRDRLDTAIELYKYGRVTRLVMSGDGRDAGNDEPRVMAEYAVQHGIPQEAITLDQGGLRTYDTCYRARQVYGLDQVALITQKFHLPRALFIGERLGLDAVGLSADQRPYQLARRYAMRELLALTVAAWDTIIQPFPDGGLAS